MEFRVLGPLEVWEAGRRLPLGGVKLRALLAILLINANRVVSSDELIELLWGDEPSETVGNTLQVYVSQLRKILEPAHSKGTPYQVVVSQSPGYLIRATADQLDHSRFERLVDEARQEGVDGHAETAAAGLREALALWRGAPLADFVDESFARAEATRLNEMRLRALEDRIEADLALGRHADLVGELEALAAEHPLRERLRAQLMLALYRSGRQAEASTVYQQTRELLVEQLGMEPGPPMQQLLKQILNQDSRLDIAVSAISVRRPLKLPRYRNALVGRRRELEQLADCLEGSSMVTLTGPGGVGKTRLAVELGAKLSGRYHDGVVFVELSPLTDQSLVPRTIASALGLRDDPAREPIEVITTHLESKSLMLVLDNCEHVLIAAATAAAELLRQCPDLIILATSRQALGVSGETIWEVPPLPSRADPQAAAGLVDTEDGDAVELFRVRAEASAPKAFIWNESVLLDATQICHKLDGIPLAIELAAARVRIVPTKDLLAGLNQRFALLTTGSSTAIPRQRSLEATVDWSYELLSPTEQAVLERLAVFAGGFSAEAAEAVCADEQLPPADVIPTLFSLVDKSLIRHGTGVAGSARYSMLETIRGYSRNKLRTRAANADVDRRHAVYFSAMASHTETELRTDRQLEWLAQLEQEHDNFRTAIEWALEAEPLVALDIAMKLSGFLVQRHPLEGSTWVTRAMAAALPNGEMQARAADLAGGLAWFRGDLDLARAFFSEAMAEWTDLGNWPRAAKVTGQLGYIEFQSGDQELGLEHMNQAIELERRLGHQFDLALTLCILGSCHLDRDDSLMAEPLLDEALQVARLSDDPWLIASVLPDVADLEASRGHLPEAHVLWEECLTLAMGLDDAWTNGDVLRGRARLALLENDPELCIRLMAASDAAVRIGAADHPTYHEDVEATIGSARTKLPDLVADRAWREGQAMTVHEAIASVLGPRLPTTSKSDSGLGDG